MTNLDYFKIAEDFSNFSGMSVSYKRYIPSVDRYVIARGRLKGVGVGVNAECFIIASAGLVLAIHYKDVEMLLAQSTRQDAI